jgi:DNA (cytosine-5)-methyltransferase 1
MSGKSQINTLKVNGVAKSSRPAKGSLVLGFDEAHKLILATEADTDMPGEIREELPAIVTHWLQSPKEKPVLMPVAYRDKWLIILREYCLLHREKSVARPLNRTKSPRPVHIDFSGIPFAPVLKPKFTFIDLFAGIGGFRIAMQGLGGKCLFSSEWEPNAKETYYNNYGEVPFGDITKFTNTGIPGALPSGDIPEHDILCAGFPCQPFSQAGLKRGFEDARGTLFFDILTIAKQRKPKVLLLENVKRLCSHNGGKTIGVIRDSLDDIGYEVDDEVLSAYNYGVPQNRERIFIVAFRKDQKEAIKKFRFPKPNRYSIYKNVGDVLAAAIDIEESKPDSKYTISDRLWAGHQRRLQEHRRKGNGFGYQLFDENSEYVSTMSARYYKDGSEILIAQKGKNPRMLTERECALILGFPDKFRYHNSKKQSYQQFGNSVAVPVVEAVGRNILAAI